MGGLVVQLAAEAGATVTAVDVPQHADRHDDAGNGKLLGKTVIVVS